MLFALSRALRGGAAGVRRASAAAYPPTGPIWQALGGAAAPGEAAFRDAGAAVCAWLGTSVQAAEADERLSTRVYGLYLPIFYWCKGLREAKAARGDAGPLCVFVSAPQGCGKTTLCDAVAHLFEREGQTCAALSYDDLYLTRAEQEAVAAEGNELTEFRGHAGTHDLELGETTLKKLLDPATESVDLPRYDKKAFGGLGDRGQSVPCAAPGVALVEGWMAGFRQTGKARDVHPGLGAVDAALPQYQRWEAFADAWLVLGLADTSTVYDWRLEAERRAGGGLSDDGVRDFVARFLPAYEAYCPGLYASAKEGLDGKPTLFFEMDKGREPITAAAADP
mmetsp:Transcript_5851/g.17285  ORF Transcript_5851/g.17285 Transcript_5851/m.17285 type:complete len:337 (+) Transcript_5851:231-1241(+)